jgi:tRNA(Arg) A34 adenosine deaminase TadA
MTDDSFLALAIKISQQSAAEGNFPAGAVVVKDGDVLATAVSSPFPNLLHADSKAVTAAFQTHGPLDGAILYVGLQPCLMCSCIAWWAGIRRIVYAVPKTRVDAAYYETAGDNAAVIAGLHEPMITEHHPACEAEALAIVKAWEANLQR